MKTADWILFSSTGPAPLLAALCGQSAEERGLHGAVRMLRINKNTETRFAVKEAGESIGEGEMGRQSGGTSFRQINGTVFKQRL